MSREAIAAFLNKVAEDESLQKDAGQHGFDFTSDELSETDLDAVAGGRIWVTKKASMPPDDQKLGIPPNDIKPVLGIPPDDQMPGR
jgi:hypothetical protein